ncbi:unnamed protein product, partial [marine sediment metagenome]
MKKSLKPLLCVLVLVVSVSMIMMFSSGGCRRAAPPVEESVIEEPVVEEVTGEPEEALDESEVEEMVEEKEKTYKTTVEGKIAFTRFYRVGNDYSYSMDDEIFIMNVDGSEQVNLTNNPTTGDGEPCFSPDGSKIAFVSIPYNGGDYEIYIINVDGSGETNLTNNPTTGDGEPCFSPDGSKIAFTSIREANREICIMNVDGSDRP